MPATTVYIAASGLHFSEFAQSKDQAARADQSACVGFPDLIDPPPSIFRKSFRLQPY